MVLHIVGSFVGLIKAKLHTNVDGTIFRLHYRWTTSFCFLACALVSATEYIGNAIQCIEGRGVPSPKAMNTFCWISGTHTINTTSGNATHYSSRGTDYLGTGNYDPNTHELTVHSYYQWVPFVLFFQGCLFYLPHLLWKMVEGKTADNLLQGLQFDSMDEEREKKKTNIVNYLKASAGHNVHYAITYLLCEALNFVNVIVQMVLLDKFFQGAFLDFGLKLFSPETSSAAIVSTFPRVTKCTFQYYGPYGKLTTLRHQCLLPQNIINEKVFIAMWFWLVVLATITAIELVWRVAVAVSPMVRLQLMERRGKLAADPNLERAIKRMHLGDYFLLTVLGINLDAGNFKDVLLKFTNCYDNSIHPNDPSYRPYNNLDEVDEGISEAAV
ncbi:innexin inx2-like [Eriocheir sinensis]|uniref:innexin inx2-like n=1 Tax=Eriocheir sinensis TaxID=95602 RepID=UPI0021C71485|nr:innexin inx2-like [Eriocheir sinensis]